VAGATWWLNDHPNQLSALSGFKTATLIQQSNIGQYTSVLWSLKLEVVFSFFLPLLLLVPIFTRNRPKWALVSAIVCFGIIAAGVRADNEYERYLPIFVLGCLLAFHMGSLSLNLSRRMRPVVSCLGTLVAICLLTTSYWTENTGAETARPIELSCIVVGACLALWLRGSPDAVGRKSVVQPLPDTRANCRNRRFCVGW
jgi:peptidoglycan/LPS O-acetylase OafA/YrhL